MWVIHRFALTFIIIINALVIKGEVLDQSLNNNIGDSKRNPILSLSLHKTSKGAYCRAITTVSVTYSLKVLSCVPDYNGTQWWSQGKVLRLDGEPLFCVIHCRATGRLKKSQFYRSIIAIFKYGSEKVSWSNDIVSVTESGVVRRDAHPIGDPQKQPKSLEKISHLICKSLGYVFYKNATFQYNTERLHTYHKSITCNNSTDDIRFCTFKLLYGYFFEITVKCHPVQFQIMEENLLISFENDLHPVLSISPDRPPEEKDEITLNCSATFNSSQRHIPRLMRITNNGSVIDNLEWTSGGNDIKCTQFNGNITLQVSYTFIVKKEYKKDRFICIVEDLLSGFTSEKEMTLTYKVAFTHLNITVYGESFIKNDTNEIIDVTSFPNMYSNATSLECIVDSVEPMPEYQWRYITKLGYRHLDSKSSKLLTIDHDIIEIRMPICCSATQQFSANNFTVEKCIHLTSPPSTLQIVTICSGNKTSNEVSCPDNTDLLITDVYVGQFDTCPDVRLKTCLSTFNSEFYRNEKCQKNNKCVNLFTPFKQRYFFNIMKDQLPSFCMLGTIPQLHFNFYCLPKNG